MTQTYIERRRRPSVLVAAQGAVPALALALVAVSVLAVH